MSKTRNGYRSIYLPDHPRAKFNYVSEHVLIAEAALGHPLPDKAVVHHHDRDGLNNSNGNLVVCQDRAYHSLIHVRMRIIRAGGDPNTDKICSKCHIPKSRNDFYNDSCQTDKLSRACKICTKTDTKERYDRQHSNPAVMAQRNRRNREYYRANRDAVIRRTMANRSKKRMEKNLA